MIILNDIDLNSLTKSLLKTTHFSEVYLLTDTANEKQYCLKSVSKSAPKPHSGRKELETMKIIGLNKNIVSLLDSWESSEDFHILMPFEKQTLAEILMPFWIPLEQKKSYLSSLLHTTQKPATTICQHDFFINKTPQHLIKKVTKDLFEGMTYLHSKNIIHRDIKLDNILYSPETDNFMIIDFGISCPFNQETKKSDDEITDISTGYYKPIEALVGIRGYDMKVDVWSGMVLLHQLSLAFVCCYDIPMNYYFEAFKKKSNSKDLIETICNMNLETSAYELRYDHGITDYNFPSFIDDGRVFLNNALCNGSDIRLLSSVHSIFGCPLRSQFPSAEGIDSWLYFFNNFDQPADRYFVDDLERQDFINEVLFSRFDSKMFKQKCLLKMCLFEFKDRISYGESLQEFKAHLGEH